MHPSIETQKVREALRALMRKRKLRNADLAARLGVSLATAKRIIGGQESLSLERLFAICDWLETPPEDLIGMARAEFTAELDYLSDEQETFLASDDAAWSLFNFLYNGRTLDEIQHLTGATRPVIDRYLRLLERHELITYTHSGHIRMRRLLGKMRPGGPLFRKHIAVICHAFATLMGQVEAKDDGTGPVPLWFKGSDYEMTKPEFQAYAAELQALLQKYSDRNRWAHAVHSLEGAGRLYALTMYYWDAKDDPATARLYGDQMPFFMAIGRQSV